MRIGLLHPGDMGVTIGQALLAAGHDVVWLAQGRSQATAARASAFSRVQTLPELISLVEGVVSVCPPGAALDQANAMSKAGYQGLYLDANAIAPSTAEKIAEVFGEQYVDGGIIGPPAVKAGTTRLYVSGAHAGEVAQWFDTTVLGVEVIADETFAASALKMAYAAYTKGLSALLLSVNALAEHHHVREALHQEWTLSQPNLIGMSERTAQGVSPKAWRFTDEMLEIAQTFRDAQMPDGFHQSAAQIYARMADLKGEERASLAQVMSKILQ